MESQKLEASASSIGGTPRSKLLLLMDVIIKAGHSAKIEIREGDNSEDLAARFAKQHGLGQKVVTRLSQHIRNQIEKHAKQQWQQQQERRLIDEGCSPPRVASPTRQELQYSQVDDGALSPWEGPPGVGRGASSSSMGSIGNSIGESGNRLLAQAQAAAQRHVKVPKGKGAIKGRKVASGPKAKGKGKAVTGGVKVAQGQSGAMRGGTLTAGGLVGGNGGAGEVLASELAVTTAVPKKTKRKARRKKKSAQPSVFERLHQQALESHSNKFLARQQRDLDMAKRVKPGLSRETEKMAMTQQWGVSRFKNQGHRLYEQGQANLKRKDQLTAKLHEDRVAKEEQECTFKPQVSAHSVALADMRGREASTVHEALFQDKVMRIIPRRASAHCALYSAPPLLHSLYTPLIHSSHTLLPHTLLSCTLCTLLSYTPLIHFSHTLLSYTSLIHSSHTLLSYHPLIHSSHSLLSYPPLIHYSHTLL
jgi:hypothetical protein